MRSCGKRFWAVWLLVLLGNQLLFVGQALATCPDQNGGADAQCYPGEGPYGEDCPANTRMVSSGTGGGGGGVDRHGCTSGQVCCEQIATQEKVEQEQTLAGQTGCQYGTLKTGSECWTDYCQPDASKFVTKCMSPSECGSKWGGQGGPGYGCPLNGQPDTNNYCCKINKNECKKDYSGPDIGQIAFVCMTESVCKTQYSGTAYVGDPNCHDPTPVCCKIADDPSTPALVTSQANFSRGFRQYVQINAFCFTEDECAKQSGPGNWVKGQGCINKGNTPQGFCKAAQPEYSLQYPVGGVKTIAGLKNFIGMIFNYAMGIVIIVAAVIFVYGGLRYLFSAVANDIQAAKTIMVDAAVGLVLGLGAYAILSNINYNTINLRSFDVYMLNTLSFTNLLYCKDVKPTSGKGQAMFQDAGTPLVPTDLDISKGYTLTLNQTQCGHEYFMEGADSLSVCTGEGCSAGACLNCASGVGSCQTNSQREHTCLEANIGGNIFVGGCQRSMLADWKNNKIEPVVFCDKVTSQEYTELSSTPIASAKESNGLVSGQIGSYALKLNLPQIKDLQSKCSGKSGLLLEYHFDTGGLGGSGLGGAWYTYIDKNCKVDASQDFFSMRLLSGNLYSESAFGKMAPENRQKLFGNAWSLDDILKTDKQTIICSFTYDATPMCTAGSTGIGSNWHD